jgi:hypothetical protein
MAGEMLLTSIKVGKGGVEMAWLTREGEKRRAPKKTRGAAKLKVEDGGQAPSPTPAAPSLVETKHLLSCKDPAHPDLQKALDGLLTPCLALLELPERYGKDLVVTGVHQSEQKGGKRGLVVNLVKTLKASKGRPLNLATPLVVEADAKADEEDEAADFFEALDQVIAEAIAYKGGKRAQGDLFDPAVEKADAAVGAGV